MYKFNKIIIGISSVLLLTSCGKTNETETNTPAITHIPETAVSNELEALSKEDIYLEYDGLYDENKEIVNGFWKFDVNNSSIEPTTNQTGYCMIKSPKGEEIRLEANNEDEVNLLQAFIEASKKGMQFNLYIYEKGTKGNGEIACWVYDYCCFDNNCNPLGTLSYEEIGEWNCNA